MDSQITQDSNPPATKELYASMRQAAGACNVPLEILRRAKAKGCLGFSSSGRVDMALVKPWLAVHMNELQEETEENSREYWSLERLKYQAKREQFAFESEQGKFLSKDVVATQLQALAAATKAILKNALENELPAKLTGLGEIEIRGILTKTVDEICGQFQGGLDQCK